MKLNCIIVDDSAIQRIAISKLVSGHQALNLVAECSNGMDAKNAFKNNAIDLVFLDIEMPVITGFDLMESLKEKPQIILITGKAEYAVKAFEYDVTDYLQKPVKPERFELAVKKAITQHELINNKGFTEDDEHIFVKSNLKKRKVYLATIKWVEALGDYIKVVTDESNIIVLSTMKAFEGELPADKFLRIHKSYIVNLERVDKFNSKFVEVVGESLPLSRNKKATLTEALENIQE
ncbi:two component transcriptional regulator, LytTR family [Pustulibacterium marinum]|uniref:Two component transcriptional regulator, LytTR family n=1 Tax=Pustulibacterium marinum TaxID=1224947 RepID=A0A1I7FTW2_9FLAO|nr:LytTR family DNA-binding domain-containing protein [Pustulibacterium marinum]SFU39446.1 two component transcriptional regulator, LytTR family [Pustulibacterium marinum]